MSRQRPDWNSLENAAYGQCWKKNYRIITRVTGGQSEPRLHILFFLQHRVRQLPLQSPSITIMSIKYLLFSVLLVGAVQAYDQPLNPVPRPQLTHFNREDSKDLSKHNCCLHIKDASDAWWMTNPDITKEACKSYYKDVVSISSHLLFNRTETVSRRNLTARPGRATNTRMGRSMMWIGRASARFMEHHWAGLMIGVGLGMTRHVIR